MILETFGTSDQRSSAASSSRVKETGRAENKIYLLSKCVERRFAEMLFYEGILHFGYPSKWIEEGKKGNVGQGDELEGVYSNEITPENFDKREDVDDPTIEGVKYLRSRRIVNWPCYCLYSISEQTEPITLE